MATLASVLAFAQVGITLVPTMIVADPDNETAKTQASDGAILALAVTQSLGLALLVPGGALLMTGRNRWLLMLASATQWGICAACLLLVPVIDKQDHWALQPWPVFEPLLVLSFASAPAISFISALSRDVREWLENS